jgi:hypothetical protein
MSFVSKYKEQVMRKILIAIITVLIGTMLCAWLYGPFCSLDKLIEQSPVIVIATDCKMVSAHLDGLVKYDCIFKKVLKGKAPVDKRVNVLVQALFIPKFMNFRDEACILFLWEPEKGDIPYMSVGNSRAVLPSVIPEDLSVLDKMELKEKIKFLFQSYLKEKKSDIEKFETEVLGEQEPK